MLLLSSLIKKIYLKSGLCFQIIIAEKSNMTANLLRKWYSEVAPKRGVFSMYRRADVYNYQVIVETPSELK